MKLEGHSLVRDDEHTQTWEYFRCEVCGQQIIRLKEDISNTVVGYKVGNFYSLSMMHIKDVKYTEFPEWGNFHKIPSCDEFSIIDIIK